MKYRKIIESGILTAAIFISSVSGVTAYAQQALADNAGGAISDENESDEEDLCDDADAQDSEGDALQEKAEEDTEWTDVLMADVSEGSWLNVREEPSEDSDVVGKLYFGSAAEVTERGDEWTKVSSGTVEGYVKNEYCVFGEDAKELALQICDQTAVTDTDCLRLRKEPGEDSAVITLLAKGTELLVDEEAEEAKGWIAVEYNGETAYISADYAIVGPDLGEAVSIEEESAQSAGSASNTSSVSADTDDVTLLAALIQCEAGSESYEGKLAVGAVVINRVKSSSYPGSISGVIYQSGQFSPASSGKLSSVLSGGSISSSCYEAASAAISGTDNTGGATSFCPGKKSGGTVIGNQTFY